MELVLNKKEVEEILRKWADERFPNSFNELRLKAQYGSFDSAEFSWTEPEKEPS